MAGVTVSGEFQVDKNKSNMVKFISDAPIENFEGITDKIDGYLFWEDSDMTKNSDVYFEVDLNALDTGIGLRNRHMRENYLETDRFPLTHFKGKIIRSQVVNDTTISVDAKGIIFIHGIEQPLSLTATLFKKINGYRIQTNFIVKLSDFQIEIPSIMFYKIDENMDLQCDFYVKEINDE
jgi:polyisoprenoid-binding protein YceI